MNVFQIDARIEELKAEIKLLNKQRLRAQNSCNHVYGDREWAGPCSYDDLGGYFQSCLKCKSVKLLSKET